LPNDILTIVFYPGLTFSSKRIYKYLKKVTCPAVLRRGINGLGFPFPSICAIGLLEMTLLKEGLTKLGLAEAAMDTAVKLLDRYIDEIELFNPAYGLVKVQDRRELIVKHIFDSLAPIDILRRLTQNAAAPVKPLIADVGSGAGLPGIPLAICMPGAEFTLIERMGRRAGFLRNTLAQLGLSNVRVEEEEMEKIRPLRSFNLVVFRAFRPLEPVIFKGLSRLLVAGGVLAAYKGRRESIEEEMARLLEQAGKGSGKGSGKTVVPSTLSWEVIPLEVPFLEVERHLLLIRQSMTDNKP